MYEPFLSLLDIEVPVIGALNGHAVGGGFGLALVCDLRVGALEAKYGANFAKLGLAPGMAISYLLPRLVGMARANELLFTGRLVDGAEAERLGILNRAVPAARRDRRGDGARARDRGNAPLAVRATKAAIRRGLDLARPRGRARRGVRSGRDRRDRRRREGIAALLAKRTPVFTGR